jgi:hypothetical protein
MQQVSYYATCLYQVPQPKISLHGVGKLRQSTLEDHF